MKLWVMSDFHRDFDNWRPPAVPEADACVVAGDVGEGLAKSMRWLQHEVGEHMPVVCVAGNHEFYRGAMIESFAEARKAAAECPGVHLLEDSEIEIGGVRFLGATLWTDYEVMFDRDYGDRGLAREYAMEVASSQMNDHRKIAWQRKPWQRFTPGHAARKHYASRAFLQRSLAQPFDGPTVVVTHHAPHRGSIAERFAKQTLTAAYASDLSDLIEFAQPHLWVHGHMHDSCDYEVGGTRIVANPKGYHAENRSFDPGFVIELPEPRAIVRP